MVFKRPSVHRLEGRPCLDGCRMLRWDLVFLLKNLKEIEETGGPSAAEVYVLRVGDEEGSLKGSEAQRNDEVGIADLFCNIRCDLDLVSDSLLAYRFRVGGQ